MVARSLPCGLTAGAALDRTDVDIALVRGEVSDPGVAAWEVARERVGVAAAPDDARRVRRLTRQEHHSWSMPIELQFATVLAAPLDVVWERAAAVSGANDELWPMAKMTFPLRLDSHTPPEQVVGREFRTWMLAFGFVPIDRRTMRIQVFEEGRFRECSTSRMMGRMCHERTAVATEHGSTVLTDTLVHESRGRLVDSLLRTGTTLTFRRRHRRLRRHFDKASARPDSA